MSGRQDDSPPSPRDVKIIALEAELEEYKEKDAKSNQIINELTRRSRDLQNEVCLHAYCCLTLKQYTVQTLQLIGFHLNGPKISSTVSGAGTTLHTHYTTAKCCSINPTWVGTLRISFADSKVTTVCTGGWCSVGIF